MRLAFLLLTIFLLACTSTREELSLYDVYSDYKSHANQDNILGSYTQYFSPSLTDGEIPDESSIPFLLFKDKMSVERNHYAKMLGKDTGCLTIDGIDNETGDPIEFNIQYAFIDGTWYIASTNIRFLESSDEYSNAAKCPSETIIQ